MQPLPADVAELLRDYLADKPAGRPVWGGTWAKDYKGAEMLRLDLEAAGIAYAAPGPDAPLYADFHALRHTYLTLGGRAGIDLRTLQELAGHSTPNLTARYSHRRLYDLAGAVEKLPRLLPENTPAEALQATGTDNESPTRSVSGLPPAYLRREVPCDSVRASERKEPKSSADGKTSPPLEMRGVEFKRERLSGGERQEAPPGFEPGMADLQSAALPLG